MSDARIRDLERRAREGDREAMLALLVQEARAGKLPPAVRDCAEGRHRAIQTTLGCRVAQVAFGTVVDALVCVDCRQAIAVPFDRVPDQPKRVTHRGHLILDASKPPQTSLRSACGHWLAFDLPKLALAECADKETCQSCARTRRGGLVIEAAPKVYAWLRKLADEHRPQAIHRNRWGDEREVPFVVELLAELLPVDRGNDP